MGLFAPEPLPPPKAGAAPGDDRPRDPQRRPPPPAHRDSLTLYLTEIGPLRRLPRDEEVDLARRARQGDEDARQRLVEAHLRLVVSLARPYAHCGVPLLDLVAEGNVGLMQAAARYDCERGFRFATYASWWVRNAILRALAEQGQVVRIPPHLVESFQCLRRAQHAFTLDHHREPTSEELAALMGLAERRVEMLLRLIRPAISLNADSPSLEQTPLLERIEDVRAESPLETAANHLLRRRLDEILLSLSEREREVIEWRFGLRDGATWSRAAIGRKLGVTREAIRQIEQKALRKLRHPSRLRQLTTTDHLP